jgi:hypothetical protein
MMELLSQAGQAVRLWMTFLLRDHCVSAPRLRIALAGLFMLAPNLAATPVFSAEKNDIYAEFEKCRVLGDDQARLACLKNLLPKTTDELARSSASDSWPLVRTPHPRGGGGPDAVSVMRTADTTRSDPELAGLMIRCAEKPGLEIVLALVRPIPPRSRRDVVVVAAGAAQVLLHAEVTSAGTALLLPVETSTFTAGPWSNTKEIAVTIRDPDGEIRGVIPIDGIGRAMAKLSANCPPG